MIFFITFASLNWSYRIKLPAAIIWASAQVHSKLFITRNTKDFPLEEPGIRVPDINLSSRLRLSFITLLNKLLKLDLERLPIHNSFIALAPMHRRSLTCISFILILCLFVLEAVHKLTVQVAFLLLSGLHYSITALNCIGMRFSFSLYALPLA